MTSPPIFGQRGLLVTKKVTGATLHFLSHFHPLPSDLSKLISKEDALEKITQNTFINLSYYLVTIIDASKAATLTWPVYDSKSDRIYRNELSTFIAGYATSGVDPVLPSYFVNPGCFKVVKLIFQLSNLALQKALQGSIKMDQISIYKDTTENYKTGSKDFSVSIEKVTEAMNNRFRTHQRKKKEMINASELLKKKIIENEKILERVKKQNIFSELANNLLENCPIENVTKMQFDKITNIAEPIPLFEDWLKYIDEQFTQMESEWDCKMRPLLENAQYCQEASQALILRHTGEMDKKLYMVEFDPKTDDIPTQDLESQVNPNQKYILKNIIKDGKLSFPNLIRGFVISMSFILKTKQDYDIYEINEYFKEYKKSFGNTHSEIDFLLKKIINADAKLQTSADRTLDGTVVSILEAPGPDLSDLKTTQFQQYEGTFNSFTPRNLSKHSFNLRRKVDASKFSKPQLRSVMTPHHTSRSDFLKGLISCGGKTCQQPKFNMSQNISIISQSMNKCNETIAGCSSGFTKLQIQRLLSTRKSSTKKHKFNSERPNLVIKKGGLFHESVESFGTLHRSHSSPNLLDSKEKRQASKRRERMLPTMQENQSLLEVSGIVALDSASNSGCVTPVELAPPHALGAATSLPLIHITSSVETKLGYTQNVNQVLNSDFVEEQTTLETKSPDVFPRNTLKSLIPVKISPIPRLEKFQQILRDTEDLQVFKPPRSRQNTSRNGADTINGNEEHRNRQNTARNSADTINGKEEHRSKHKAPRNSADTINGKEEFLLKPTCVKENSTRRSTESITVREEDSVTPKSNIPLRESGSLEKIINRFKKVRASVVAEGRDDYASICRPILEEKENQNALNSEVHTANRVLLPDLLSPSYGVPQENFTESAATSDNYFFELDHEELCNRPRESLGAMLGVDDTFLDQFNLVD